MADNQFRVSFVAQNFEETINRLREAGKQLDNLSKLSGNMEKNVASFNKTYAKGVETMLKTLDGVSKSLSKAKGNSDEFAASAEFFLGKLAMEANNTQLAMLGLTRGSEGLHKVMVKTANDKLWVKYLQDSTTAATRLEIELLKLSEQQKILTSETAKEIAVLKENNKHSEKMLTVDTKRAIQKKELREALDFLYTTQGKELIQLQEAEKHVKRLNAEEAKRVYQLRELRSALAYAQSPDGAKESVTREQLKFQEELNVLETKRRNNLAKLRSELAYLNTTDGQRTLQLKEAKKQIEELSVWEERRSLSVEKNRRELDFLTTAEGKKASIERELVRVQQELNVEETKRTAIASKLSRDLNYLNTTEGRQVEIDKELIRGKKQLIAEETRRNHVLQQAQRELAYLQSAEGKQLQLIRQQIAEERRLTVERARSTGVLNQANAAFRATLTGLRASIGMYTSGTILIATAMYGVSRAFRTGLEQGAEFSASMARASAILNTTGDMMVVVEDKVRTLGRTTQFTSVEAASALIELGMAGLTAGDAITALKPTLDLATIGNISLADSAKLSTDILLMFNKEASELGNIVDVMAVAVTNSNATISELTNSISYAGPAAATLGMSVEDVTASVEMLANAGIRGSRAGTALRRMFLNLAKPTAAGQAALDKFGISVTDFNGKTRDLTTILELFQNKLGDLSNDERLKVLTEIFGVRAASGVNILVSQANQVRVLREQLDDAGGAAEEMQNKIRDSLDFDFKELKSAFQELQLAVFKDNEMTFRIWTQELKGFVTYLGESTDGVTTRLEKIVTGVAKIGRAFAIIMAANYAGKLAMSMSTLVTSIGSATTAFRTMASSAAISLTNITTMQGAATVATTLTTRATHGLTTAMTALGRAIPVIGWIAAGASALYSIYEVIRAMYSKDINEDIATQNDLMREQRMIYDELKASSRATDLLETIKSEQEALRKTNELLEEKKQRLVVLKALQEESTSEGATEFYIRQILIQNAEIEKLGKTVEGLEGSYKKALKAREDFEAEQSIKAGIRRQIEGWEKRKAELRNEINSLENDWFVQSREHKLKVANAQMARIEIAIKNLGISYDEAGKKIKEVNEQMGKPIDLSYNPLEIFKEQITEIRKTLDEEFIEGKKTDWGKLVGLQFDAGEAMEEAKQGMRVLQEFQEGLGGRTVLTDDEKERYVAILSTIETNLKRVRDLEKDIFEARNKNAEHQNALNEKLRAAEDQAIARKEILLSLSMKEVSSGEREAKLIKDRAAIQARINNLAPDNFQALANQQDKLNKVNAELNSILKGRAATYINLYNAAEPVQKAERDYANTLSQLTKLLNDGDIQYDSYAKAMGQAWESKQKIIDANNKELQSLLALRKAYGDKTFSFVDERMQINRLRGTEYGDEVELNRMEDRLREKEFASFDFKRPDSLTRGMGRGVDMPQAAMTLLDVAGGHEQYNSLFSQIGSRYDDALIENYRIYEEEKAKIFDREFTNEVERMEELEAIRQEYYDRNVAANEAKNEMMKRADDEYAEYTRQTNMLLLSESLGFASDMAGQLSQISEEGSRTQKVAFGVSKALAAAQVIMNAHLAASKVPTEYPTMAAAPIQAMILAQGYSSAAMITAMAIKQYDKGGFIPHGDIGIVGEYGPEIVHGPANVTSRKETLDKLTRAEENSRKGGGGNNIKIVNAFDTKAIGDYLNTGEGEKLLLNTMKRNRQTIKGYIR